MIESIDPQGGEPNAPKDLEEETILDKWSEIHNQKDELEAGQQPNAIEQAD